MAVLEVIKPMHGCRVVVAGDQSILFGQPPEVLKALMKADVAGVDAIVLPDVRKRSGVLLNNVEFLLYFFLFFGNGLAEQRRLAMIGDALHISQIITMLRFTLLGPTREEYERWGTPPVLRDEWLNASEFFALKDDQGRVRPVAEFFDSIELDTGEAHFGPFRIERAGLDRFIVERDGERVEVDLDSDEAITPPYAVAMDYVPSGLVRFGVEVLGGASGFSPEEPSTGFVLCFNGHYILIDAIPYLDEHLRARGISRNQISALFLTHIHDDHCNLFPLMSMPQKLDLITTREIYHMAMLKLSMGLGWTTEAVAEHFNFVEITVGEILRYYGLEIDAHHTVHSIPTIGATFRMLQHGRSHEICLVGDIQTFSDIAKMREQGLVRPETEEYLQSLYRKRFDLLIADGGMGPIHGDPSDALGSEAERVVFVHVEKLPERFNATFSLAGSGKRYTILDADSDVYATRTIEFLMDNFDHPLSTRWLSTLFADKVLKRYNTDDVIIKQDSATWGSVFLVLTGYCEVIHHDGERFETLATREAGDLMGEMAIVTGHHLRNASVVARTPVMACEFSETAFDAFVVSEGLKEALLARWARRRVVGALPQFAGLSTVVIDTLCSAADLVEIAAGESGPVTGAPYWGIVVEGEAEDPAGGPPLIHGSEFGTFVPHAAPGAAALMTREGCTVLCIAADTAQGLVTEIPQLNHRLRSYRESRSAGLEVWQLTAGSTN